MRIKLSRILNGPAISDNLQNGLSGFDLSGNALDGGTPGDTTFFTLYLSVEATETEQAIYDYLKYISLYIDSNNQYTGDYDSSLDYEDILELGDLGYGLSIKNPATGLYDIIFNTSNYNSKDNSFMIKKEMMLWYDLTDVNNPTIIKNDGFIKAIAAASSSGYSLKTTTNVFTPNMVDCRVYNVTDGTSSVVETYISASEVILANSIGDTWDGDTLQMKQMVEPQDGLIAVNAPTAEIIGNYAKLEFKYSLPSFYNRTGVKQWALKAVKKI